MIGKHYFQRGSIPALNVVWVIPILNVVWVTRYLTIRVEYLAKLNRLNQEETVILW